MPTDGESRITFADGITTIKVDTTLELGDKTLIIDGGGDVILDGAYYGTQQTRLVSFQSQELRKKW